MHPWIQMKMGGGDSEGVKVRREPGVLLVGRVKVRWRGEVLIQIPRWEGERR